MKTLVQNTPRGLYCAAGDFYIDPARPVKRAVITHAHADHARPGCQSYLCAREGQSLLQTRLGADTRIEGRPYGETINLNGVTLSLHPAGHIRGSAQVRIEQGGQVAVVSGDYKTDPDPSQVGPYETIQRAEDVGEVLKRGLGLHPSIGIVTIEVEEP